MDIACPNCAATYRVPDSLLGSGTALRCAACDHEWVPEAAVPPPGEVPLVVPLVTEPDLPEAAPAEPPWAEAPRPVPARPASPTEPPPLQRRATPAPRSAEPRPTARRLLSRALPIAWVASIMLVVSALLGLVMFGDRIALAWPPFARVTALLSG